jgi:hypothetical protein
MAEVVWKPELFEMFEKSQSGKSKNEANIFSTTDTCIP